MAQYKTGTASVTNGSSIVTGISTLWSANISVGDLFMLIGDGVSYEVGSVDTDLQITLTANYAGPTATGAFYAITRDFTPNLNIPYVVTGDIETAAVIKRALMDIDSGKHVNQTPASASDTGVAGAVTWDANYIYVCIAANSWKRTGITAW